MEIGKITARVRVEKAIPALEDKRLYAVTVSERTLVAADLVGATEGSRVVLATGEIASRCCMELPVDAAIVAIVKDNA